MYCLPIFLAELHRHLFSVAGKSLWISWGTTKRQNYCPWNVNCRSQFMHFLLEMLNGLSVHRCDNHTTSFICSRTWHFPVSIPLFYSVTFRRPLDLLRLELSDSAPTCSVPCSLNLSAYFEFSHYHNVICDMEGVTNAINLAHIPPWRMFDPSWNMIEHVTHGKVSEEETVECSV